MKTQTKKSRLIILSIILSLLIIPLTLNSVSAATINISGTLDTYVNPPYWGWPTRIFALVGCFGLCNAAAPDGIERYYIQPALNINGNITSAIYYLHVSNTYFNGTGTWDSANISVHRVTSTWDDTMDYSTQPTFSSSPSSYKTLPGQPISFSTFVPYWANFTMNASEISAMASGALTNYGFVFKTDEVANKNGKTIDTYDDTYIPYLSITYDPYVTIISPTTSQIFVQDAPTALLNISTLVNMTTCYYNDGTSNFTMTKVNNQSFYNSTAGAQLLDGAHTISFWCNQSSDGVWINSNSISFNIDSLNITTCRNLTIARNYSLINNITFTQGSCLIVNNNLTIQGNNNNITMNISSYTDENSISSNGIYNITINNLRLFQYLTTANTYRLMNFIGGNNQNRITLNNVYMNGSFISLFLDEIGSINISNSVFNSNLTKGGSQYNSILNLFGLGGNENSSITNSTVFGIGGGDFALDLGSSIKDLIINNSNITGGSSFGQDIKLDNTYNDGKIYVLNTTSSNESIPTGSQLIRQWYFNVNVKNSTSNLSLATVNFYNVTGTLISSLLTDSSGNIPQQTLIQYINDGGTKINQTPYTINVSKTGYVTNTSIINFTSNYQHNVVLSSNDIIPPNISIIYPANTTYQSVTQLNYSIDATASSCWYATNLTSNVSISCGTNVTGLSATSGSNTWKVWANDSLGNLNTSSVTFTIDNTAPSIVIVSPNNNYTTSTIFFNLSSNENLSSCLFTLNNWITNYTMTLNSTLRGANYTNSSVYDGSYTLKFWCNDSYNNVNNTQFNFSVDTVFPQVSITSPSNNSNTTNTNLIINYTSSDLHLSSCWWTNNSGTTNHSLTNCSTNITGQTWKQGQTILRVYSNDTFGNINSSEIYFFVDNIAPTINILFPVQGNSYNYHNQTLNFSVSDSGVGLDTCLKSLNGGANVSINCALNNTVNSTGQGTIEGTNTITVYVNDTLNNRAKQTITYYISTTGPAISLTKPLDTSWLNSSLVTFNFTNSSVNYCKLYGNFNGTWGVNQTTLNGLFSIFNITDGSYIWNVWCNDSLNNIAYAPNNFTFSIDTIFPQISFGTGTENNNSNKSQSFIYVNISITEININNVSLNIYNNTNLVATVPGPSGSGTINSPSLSDGVYYYNVTTCDFAGNCNSTETRTITLDTINPNATLLTPINNSYNSTLAQNFSANLTDNLGIKNATLNIWNQSGQYNITSKNMSSGVTQTIFTNIVNMVDGIYNWWVNLFDWSGNSYSTNNNTLTIDTIAPVISIISPANTSYSSNSILLNVINSESGSLWYSLNGGSNTTFTNPTTITAIVGLNNITVCGNDSANNTNCSLVFFSTVSSGQLSISLSIPQTIEFGKNITLQANATSLNPIVSCNFSLSSPTLVIFNNQNGTQSGTIWNSSSYIINETGHYTYNVTCFTAFGVNSTSLDSFDIAYNLTYSPTNYSFASKLINNETNSFSVYMYDNSNSSVNYSIKAAIQNSSNFTLAYPAYIILNDTDSQTNPFGFNFSINASNDTAIGIYLGNITLTNVLNNQTSMVFFSYSLNPPSGIPEIYSIFNNPCTSTWGAECSFSTSLTQGASTNLVYKIGNIGGYDLTSCTIKGTNDFAGASWLSSETFNLPALNIKTLTISLSPTTSTNLGTYSGYLYISCASGDASGSQIDTETSNRPYIKVIVSSVSPGGGGGNTTINKTELLAGICGNKVCETGENFATCPGDCQGNLDPLTSCFSSDAEIRKSCIFYQRTALIYIFGFIAIIIIFTLFFKIEKQTNKRYARFIPITIKRKRRRY